MFWRKKKRDLFDGLLTPEGVDNGIKFLAFTEGWQHAAMYRARHGIPENASDIEPPDDLAEKAAPFGERYMRAFYIGMVESLKHPEVTGDANVIARVYNGG
ncbi:hypothetical protein [Jiangella muralis]|uniref:hypothetical protein n=1 Tax=Jiangella muralis TaxID=702383 RepID=UPI00069EC443|nr:hypothetical protein [Jiangella muralis]